MHSDWDVPWNSCLYTIYVMHLSSSISRLLFLNFVNGIFGQGSDENYYIRTVFKVLPQSGTNWLKLHLETRRKTILFTVGSGHTQEFQRYFGLCLHRCWWQWWILWWWQVWDVDADVEYCWLILNVIVGHQHFGKVTNIMPSPTAL